MDGTPLQSFAVTPELGNVFYSPEQLQAIALAAGAGGRVELNSFQQLILHTSEQNVEETSGRLRALGLGVYPVGAVVKNLHTCTFCMGERVEGLPDAQRLDSVVAGIPVPFTVRVGFSGCQNNCGEALLRDIGIVRMETGYDIFIGGRAAGLTPAVGTKVADGIPGDRLPVAVRAILECYRQIARGKQRFWKTVQRHGTDPFREAIDATQQN
jgi:precorrin-3B C17-methyltransferase